MVAFCREHRIPHEVCGKIIVATDAQEFQLLEDLYQRGVANGLEVMKLSREEVLEFEPHVSCQAALRVPSTGIVDYRMVCGVFAKLIRTEGGEIRTKAEVREFRSSGDGYVLESAHGRVETKFLINCGGLQSDRIARRTGLQPQARIMPFRGEYYQLIPEKRHLVKGLIYPTPDPAFPFLGVHFTRMIDGSVHAGPNAVLALRREGYRKSDIGLGASLEILTYGGCWKLARRHFRVGIKEVWRSISKRAFTNSLRRLIPEVCEKDLIPAMPGVRAQALLPNGQLVDDFLIQHGPHSLHVCNAPSPAATASLEIGEAVAALVPELRMAAAVC